MLKLVLASAVLFFSTTNHVGETTKFVKNPSLTSFIIKQAEIKAEVQEPSGTDYGVKMNCYFDIVGVGRLGGTTTQLVPASLLDGEMLQHLREDGEFVAEQYKVKHEGYQDVRLQSGKAFSHADKIRVYDIDPDLGSENECFQHVFESDDLQDLELTAWVVEGMPVGGLVRFILTGKKSGIAFKAGLDYSE